MKTSKHIVVVAKDGGFSRTNAVAEYRKQTGCTGEVITHNRVYGGTKKSVYITHE